MNDYYPVDMPVVGINTTHMQTISMCIVGVGGSFQARANGYKQCQQHRSQRPTAPIYLKPTCQSSILYLIYL